MIIYLAKNNNKGHMAFLRQDRALSHLIVCDGGKHRNYEKCNKVESIIFCTYEECM